jgi:hypothetical protein
MMPAARHRSLAQEDELRLCGMPPRFNDGNRHFTLQ